MKAEDHRPREAAAALLRALPDTPQWVETRSMLLSDACVLFSDPGGAVVTQPRWPHMAIVGRPDPTVLREAAARAPHRAELLVPPESEDHVIRALPGWEGLGAVIHSLPAGLAETMPAETTRVRLLSRNRPPPLLHVPEGLRRELEDALESCSHVAAAYEEGMAVSFCYPGSETETLWDVSVDTLEPFRRRGLAGECARFLIQHMTVHGKEPVWASFETNGASLRLAQVLGFQPVGRVVVFYRAGEAPCF